MAHTNMWAANFIEVATDLEIFRYQTKNSKMRMALTTAYRSLLNERISNLHRSFIERASTIYHELNILSIFEITANSGLLHEVLKCLS